MILHLTDDIKLINDTYFLFEKYYPGQNVFIVQVSRNGLAKRQVESRDRTYFKSFTSFSGIKEVEELARIHNVKQVLVHYLTPTKAALATRIHQRMNVELYWMFFGADLYEGLHKSGKYELLDKRLPREQHSFKKWIAKVYFFILYRSLPNDSYKTFISSLNYFCFWNQYDFKLLLKNFSTKASFRDFMYFSLIDRSKREMKEKTSLRILVNHSASLNGNHLTVLNKLRNILANERQGEVIVPLSYGNDKIKNEVIQLGESIFGDRFRAITDYLPMNSYYELLSRATVAIFGNRRQEGAGNVFYLLSTGVKVFLRNENNMGRWLKENGFLIYSFEDDLNSMCDLGALSLDEMKHNRKIYENLFSTDIENRIMKDLIQ